MKNTAMLWAVLSVALLTPAAQAAQRSRSHAKAPKSKKAALVAAKKSEPPAPEPASPRPASSDEEERGGKVY